MTFMVTITTSIMPAVHGGCGHECALAVDALPVRVVCKEGKALWTAEGAELLPAMHILPAGSEGWARLDAVQEELALVRACANLLKVQRVAVARCLCTLRRQD